MLWNILMATMQVRTNLQKALGRPLALDEASAKTIGEIRAMDGGSSEENASNNDKESPSSTPKDTAKKGGSLAPVIRPCKIVDLARDLCVRKELTGGYSRQHAKAPVNADTNTKTTVSPSWPATPDRVGIIFLFFLHLRLVTDPVPDVILRLPCYDFKSHTTILSLENPERSSLKSVILYNMTVATSSVLFIPAGLY